MCKLNISVLILTHNRPKLFERCLNSVICAYKKYNVNLEILVNNDSNDIKEIYYDNISIIYKYNTNKNLGILYKNLFLKASNEYIYFLEDDDTMYENFFKTINNYKKDIIYGHYIPHNWNKDFINFFKYKKYNSKDDFLNNYNDTHFQFSQICFKKNTLNIDDFPITNNINNDFNIFKLLKGSFININKILYKQTTDGQDNISFLRLNKDKRWDIQKK